MNIGGATRLLLRPLCCRYFPNTKDKHEESKFTLAAARYVPCCYAMLINPICRSKQLHAVASLLSVQLHLVLVMLCFCSYIRGLIIQLFAYVSAFSPPHQFILCSLLLFLWRGGCRCSQMFINIFNLNDVKKKKKNSDNKFLLTITWLEKSEIGELIADRESHVSESLSLRQIICSVTSTIQFDLKLNAQRWENLFAEQYLS